jgi:hypothetical protein
MASSFSTEEFKVAKTGYIGSRVKESLRERTRTYNLHETVGPNSELKF